MKQIILQTFFLTNILAQNTITNCDPVPTNTVDSTAYTTVTETLVANGKQQVAVVQKFKAVEYISDCSAKPSSLTSDLGTKKVTIF